jgi:hypothetical protein
MQGSEPVTGKMPVPQVLPLKWKHYIIYYQLPITNYLLPITNYLLPITYYSLSDNLATINESPPR